MVCVRLYIYYTKPPDHLCRFDCIVQTTQVLQIFLCKPTKSLHRRQICVDKHEKLWYHIDTAKREADKKSI